MLFGTPLGYIKVIWESLLGVVSFRVIRYTSIVMPSPLGVLRSMVVVGQHTNKGILCFSQCIARA